MPNNIVLDKWADIGFTWQGEIRVTEFNRLTNHLDLQEQLNHNGSLTVAVTLTKKDNILWLSYGVDATLWVPCQRCLSALALDASGEYILAILTDESQRQAVKETEFVLLDEVCPNEGRKMLPIKDLLEDELLLALPIAPKHDDCEMLLERVGEEIEEQLSKNPFSILAQLKHQ